MRKSITAAAALITMFLIAALVAPTAQALVPPEPVSPATSPIASIEAGVSLMSWQTAIVAVIAVAAGAVIALAAEHFVRRDRSSGLAAT